MISYSEARHLIRQVAREQRFRFQKNRIDEVTLLESVGRVLAEDILSPQEFPLFKTSAMDGFAISSRFAAAATPSTPVTFKILGTISAGTSTLGLKTPEGSGWKIMTGGAVPNGCDACVKIEDAGGGINGADVKANNARARSKDAGVAAKSERRESGQADFENTNLFDSFTETFDVFAPVHEGTHVRQIGEDFQFETRLFAAGHRLRHEDILILATLGVRDVKVFGRARVALIATGSELVDHTKSPRHGEIRNSTVPYLSSVLKSCECQVTDLGSVSDQGDDLIARLEAARRENYDLILTTGGISVGQFDRVTESIAKMGAEVLFQKVKIRPGKPVLFARLRNGSALIGLPGNPVASVVAFRFFAQFYLENLISNTVSIDGLSGGFALPLAVTHFKKTIGTEFLKARLIESKAENESGSTFGENITHVFPIQNQQASLLHTLIEADGWLELRDSTPGEIAAGTPVLFHPFEFQRSERK